MRRKRGRPPKNAVTDRRGYRLPERITRRIDRAFARYVIRHGRRNEAGYVVTETDFVAMLLEEGLKEYEE